MKNIYDIKYDEKLNYIFDLYNNILPDKQIENCRIAIVWYLYYLDTVEKYFTYFNNIPQSMDLYIISSSQEVLDKCKSDLKQCHKENLFYILKPNEGRDISGLLVTAKDIVRNHNYVCFVHDKKGHTPDMKKDTDLWIDNIWGNLLGSTSYIYQVLNKFEEDKRLGVLVPPAPIGDNFCTWYGYGWHGSFNATKRLAEQLGLKCDLDETKPPITIGTALWFKREALEKLFEYPWLYSSFDDSKLFNPDYLSFGVERIFAYVAQDAGYLTGEIMSADYAVKQNLFLQYSMTEIFQCMQPFFPFPTLNNVRNLNNNLHRLEKYVSEHKKIYLYGAGDVGRFCLTYLRKKGCTPDAFLVSNDFSDSLQTYIDGIPLYCISAFKETRDYGVIVTVVRDEVQKQIIKILDEKGITDYFLFWR